MARLRVGGVLEQARDVREPFDVGDAGEVEVAPIRLRLSGERVLEILVALVPFRLFPAMVILLPPPRSPGGPVRMNDGTPARGAIRPAPGRRRPAGGTAAEELDAVMRDGEPGERGHPGGDGAGGRFAEGSVHVHDATTAGTREVMVPLEVPIEAGVRSRQLVHQPLRHQQAQVAVHRAQAHPRQAPPHHAMHRLRGGMGLGAAHHLEDDAAGPGEPQAPRAQRARRAGIGSATGGRPPGGGGLFFWESFSESFSV